MGAVVRTRIVVAVSVMLAALFCCPAIATAASASKNVAAEPPVKLCSETMADGGPASTQAADAAAKVEDWASARSIYTAVLASPASTADERACAAAGLVYVADKSETPTRQAAAVQGSWDGFYAKWVRPCWRFGLPALAVFAVLLAILRFVTSLVCRWPAARGLRRYTPLRRALLGAAWLSGILAIAWAAVMVTVGLALSDGDKHTWAIRWMQLVAGLATTATVVVLVIVVFTVGRRPGRGRWFIAGAAAVALLAAGIWSSLELRHDDRSWLEIVRVAVACAAAGIVLAARTRGIGMGLRIEGIGKTGDDDKGLAADVRARLVALGSRKPRGIQMTEQTDVSTLPQDALSLVPDGVAAKAATLILKLFTKAEPWRVRVSERPDGAMGVEVLHNRVVVKTAVVTEVDASLDAVPDKPMRDGSAMGADTKTLALHTAAASFVLLQLSRFHHHLTDGLVGTRDWRSLAAQVIALEPASQLSAAAVKALITNSVGLDDGNLAAQCALQFLRYPTSTIENESSYLVRMEPLLARIEQHSDGASLLMRTRFNLAASGCNLGLLLRAAKRDMEADAAIYKAHEQICALASALTEGDDGNELEEEIRQATYWLHLAIDSEQLPPVPAALRPEGCPDPAARPDIAIDPFVRYQRACFLAKSSPSDALDDLAIAAGRPDLRSAAASDPSFQALREEPDTAEKLKLARRYKTCVGDPVAATAMELPAFAGRRAALAERGITTPHALLRVPTRFLARDLAVSTMTARTLRRTAALYMFVSEHSGADPNAAPAATAQLLINAGIASMASLRVKLQGELEALRAELDEAATSLAVIAPSTATLTSWRDNLTLLMLARSQLPG